MKTLLPILLLCLTISSCRWKYDDTFDKVNALKEKKELLSSVSSEKLNTENHLIIKDYFKSIKELIYEFKNNSKMMAYTNKKFQKYYTNQLCENIILDIEDYQKIMKKCNQGGFYICSEEAKHYFNFLSIMKKLLSKQSINYITRDNKCSIKLGKLGVIE